MTDQEIYELLINVDYGYKLTEEEYQQLSSATSITWRNIMRLPHSIGLLKSVTKLDLSGYSYLANIRTLSGLTGLTTLSLTDTDVRDISALKGLTGLTTLNLRHTGVNDISALSGLAGLTTLSLANTDVRDISALSGLTGLTNLD